ncbi:MAG: hypothetical protein H7122_07275 [Chitinophagaceae bacterium]|nr:hypothetical protein [Chitinophagaceae bacterium]
MSKLRDSFWILKMIHLCVLTGTSIFAIISLLITANSPVTIVNESTGKILQVVAVVFSASSLFIGFGLFKKKIMAARASIDPAEKRMERYRIACIIWWTMIEAPGLFAIAGYLFTSNLAFFFLAALHILILLLFTPRKGNIILLLNFNNEEVTHLERKEKFNS